MVMGTSTLWAPPGGLVVVGAEVVDVVAGEFVVVGEFVAVDEQAAASSPATRPVSSPMPPGRAPSRSGDRVPRDGAKVALGLDPPPRAFLEDQLTLTVERKRRLARAETLQ